MGDKKYGGYALDQIAKMFDEANEEKERAKMLKYAIEAFDDAIDKVSDNDTRYALNKALELIRLVAQK